MSTLADAQRDIIPENKDTVIIWINGKHAAGCTVQPEDNNIGLIIKKTTVKTVRQLQLQVKGPSVNSTIYKRTLQVNTGTTMDIAEINGEAGHFDISNNSLVKRFTSGKKIPVYLMLEPANPMMMISSKKIFLCNLMMK
jgi:hypothetical protein